MIRAFPRSHNAICDHRRAVDAREGRTFETMNPYSQIPTHNLDYLVYTRREPIAVVFAATGQTSSRTTVDCGPTPVRVFGPGIGRKNGVEAMDAYLHTRSVWVELAGPTRDPFTLG